MKTRLIAFLILLTFLVEVRGFVPGETNNVFPIGSITVVSNYCLVNGKNLAVYIQQYNNNGILQTYTGREEFGPFPSKEVIDQVVQYKVSDAINELIANKNNPEYGHDINRPFWVYAFTTFTSDGDIYFNCFQELTLTKNGSTYSIPDLNYIKVGLAKRIPYKLNGITWAHIETTNHIDSTLRIDDSRAGSTNIQKIRKQGFFRIMIPCSDAINADGTNVSMKINVLNSTNQFEVYENSQQVAERQPRMAITYVNPMQPFMVARSMGFMGPQPQSPTSSVRNFFIEPQSFILKVTGGEIGRTYRILTTTSINEPYTDTNSRHRVTPTSITTSMTLEFSEGNRFFQVQSIDVAPTY